MRWLIWKVSIAAVRHPRHRCHRRLACVDVEREIPQGMRLHELGPVDLSYVLHAQHRSVSCHCRMSVFTLPNGEVSERITRSPSRNPLTISTSDAPTDPSVMARRVAKLPSTT